MTGSISSIFGITWSWSDHPSRAKDVGSQDPNHPVISSFVFWSTMVYRGREHGEAEDLQGKYHGFCAQMSRGEVNSSVVHPGDEQACYS